MVGVRPQKLNVVQASNNKGIGTLPARLIVHEFLGKNGIAQVEVDHSILECVTPPVIPHNVGDDVCLTAQFEDLHIFDSATTLRIAY